jgi:hypothetical protein
MATRADFTEDEWKHLHQGVSGAGMLVSLADRDFSDSFGEATALAKFLAGQAAAGATPLMREIAGVHTTGFGLVASPAAVHDETMAALSSSVATLTAKAPDEVEPYRKLVLDAAEVVAEAKGGVKPAEAAAIAAIKDALGEG